MWPIITGLMASMSPTAPTLSSSHAETPSDPWRCWPCSSELCAMISIIEASTTSSWSTSDLHWQPSTQPRLWSTTTSIWPWASSSRRGTTSSGTSSRKRNQVCIYLWLNQEARFRGIQAGAWQHEALHSCHRPRPLLPKQSKADTTTGEWSAWSSIPLFKCLLLFY